MSASSVCEARHSDLVSLSTIVPRSFHPVNPYIKQALPDTPIVRTWWSRIFEDEMKDENCHLLIALDSDAGRDAGILTLRLLSSEERGAGFWTIYNWTEDHDYEMTKSMIDCMVEARERLMSGKAHYLIELFGVDHTYKGRGLGMKLLERACQIADQDGYDVFVQANASAKGFYARLGFEGEGEAVMPGDAKYTEYMMVRRYCG